MVQINPPLALLSLRIIKQHVFNLFDEFLDYGKNANENNRNKVTETITFTMFTNTCILKLSLKTSASMQACNPSY